MKILAFDIETSPIISYNWGVWEQNAIKIVKDWHILCFAYQWVGEKEIHYVKGNGKDDKSVAKALWKLFDEADVVMAHNGNDFDIKKARARFIHHGLTAPSPFKSIDTKVIAKRIFGFNFNSLNEVAKYLGCPFLKLDTGGFSTWEGCMADDQKAWEKMIRYNKRDVKVLVWIYNKLKSYMPNHPNMNLVDAKAKACPTCKSTNIQKRGIGYTSLGSHQRYACNNCGSWSRGLNSRTKEVELR